MPFDRMRKILPEEFKMNKSKRIMAFILALLMLGSVAWIAISAVVYGYMW